MSFAIEKELIIQEIKECNDEWKVNAIKRILHDTETDIDLYNQELDEAVEEIKNGNFITHEALIEKMKSW